MSEMLEQINNTIILPEEMDAFLKAMEEDDGEPCFERAVFIAREVFNNRPQKRLSINMRMVALSKLIENEALPGWVKPQQPDGSYRVAANIYVAAGLELMIEVESDWGFDIESLLKRAFRLGQVDV